MIADALNSHGYSVRMEMTAQSLHVCSMDEDNSKGIIVQKPLSQSFSTDKYKSKGIIINKTLSQNCSTDKDKLFSTEEDKSECDIKKQKDANNEVTYDVPKYFNSFNVFKCGRNILDRLDVLYERSCMATPKEEYFMEMLDSLLEHNHCHGTQLSSKKLL